MTSTPSTASVRPLLIELLTEELPPKALQKLGLAFADGIHKVLDRHHLLASGCTSTDFSTPRRLAVHLSAVLGQAPEQRYTEKLMPAKIGLTESGEMTPALVKKLAAKGLHDLTAADLVHESDGKQDYLYARGTTRGALLAEALQEALDYAITHLPIPKVMRYQLGDGITSVKFVRPAHKLVALWGDQVVPVQALGLNAGRETQGHRFMAQQDIILAEPHTYTQQLLDEGKVVASFTERR